MATITHGGVVIPTGKPERTAFGKLALWALFAWGVIGPLLGLWYGHHVDTAALDPTRSLPAAQAEDIEVAYFADAAFNYVVGAVVWGVVLLGVAITAWLTRAED